MICNELILHILPTLILCIFSEVSFGFNQLYTHIIDLCQLMTWLQNFICINTNFQKKKVRTIVNCEKVKVVLGFANSAMQTTHFLRYAGHSVFFVPGGFLRIDV